jgi:hypothetical protein
MPIVFAVVRFINQLEFGRLLHRHISGFLALEASRLAQIAYLSALGSKKSLSPAFTIC